MEKTANTPSAREIAETMLAGFDKHYRLFREKSAQANNIRRREETAATRSLLNTARVMEENPTALRLKELETLEKVTEKIDKISVYGGLDGVLKGLINIQQPK